MSSMRGRHENAAATRKAAARGALAAQSWLAGGDLNFSNLASKVGTLAPTASPEWNGIRVERDVPFGNHGQTLDVYWPVSIPAPGAPICFYIHGGGFRILSKQTHWVFGLTYAKQGFITVVPNYRLAPEHPFPAAVIDVGEAFCETLKLLKGRGASSLNCVFAGESAGANLVLALTLMCVQRRAEPYARQVFECGVTPQAIVPTCGILEVSNVERFSRASTFVSDRLREIEDAYLGGVELAEEAFELANPLLALERSNIFERAFPATLVACGTWDILLDDSRRLYRALTDGLGNDGTGGKNNPCELKEYEHGLHAFHAFVGTSLAKKYWNDTFEFLKAHVTPVGHT
jgi:acetyl esterase